MFLVDSPQVLDGLRRIGHCHLTRADELLMSSASRVTADDARELPPGVGDVRAMDESAVRPAAILRQFGHGVAMTFVLLVVCGVIYPATLYALGHIAFARQSRGSLIHDRAGRVVGSALIGQSFARPEYFHGRRSATSYNAANTSGSNLGPTNPALIDSARASASRFRAENSLSDSQRLPSDVGTSSGSGIDPDISPANAWLQIARVARARSVDTVALHALVDHHVQPRQLFVLGEPRVNVLLLNLATDSAFGAPSASPAGPQ
jgi:K+-transporting ATPase ATPase C chain